MKMRYDKLWLVCVALFAGCTADVTEDSLPGADDSPLRLGASLCRVITRSGDTAERFADGTKYDLYALDAASGGANWLNTGSLPALLSNIEGTENYAANEVVYGAERVSYDGRTVDIYAATLGTTDNPGAGQGGVSFTAPTGTSGPKYSLAVASDGSLPGIADLMRVKYPGAQSRDGKIALEFRHTLSKLTFDVVKQDETADAAALHELDGVFVASIRLKNARTSGTLDLASGNWESLAGGDTPADEYRTFFTAAATPWEVPHTTPQRITTGDGATGTAVREIFIFPNTDAGSDYLAGERSRPLAVEVTLGKTGDASYSKTVTYSLLDVAVDGTPTADAFRFRANYEYRLTITVQRDDVRILTISPQVYDWIPAFPGGDMDIEYLGQPVTFGNLTWMDRNLGAESGDCRRADNWYDAVGYYYQQGRNLPFIMDKERWMQLVDTDPDRNLDLYQVNTLKRLYVMKIDGQPVPATWNYADKDNDPHLIYTYDYYGERTYGAHLWVTGSATDIPFLPVRFPGQMPLKRVANVLVEAPENMTPAYKFSLARLGTNGGPNTWYSPMSEVMNMWNSVDDHPCPAGWRLPTSKDYKCFLPAVQVNWADFTWPMKTTDRLCFYGNFVQNGVKVYRARHVVNRNRADAYRIQIESRPAAGCTNKYYIHVARFKVTDPSLYIDAYAGDEQWDQADIVEEMYFPATGGIVSDGALSGVGYTYVIPPEIRWFGKGTVLRTSAMASSLGCYVCYMALSDMQLSMSSTSRPVLGCQVRCVRDVR